MGLDSYGFVIFVIFVKQINIIEYFKLHHAIW